MKATALEFRFRFFILAVLYGLGFVAPWNLALHLDPAGANPHVWGILAAKLALGTAAGFQVLLIIAMLFALSGALFRVWGAAYLGAGVVHSFNMQSNAVVADGPYRRLRNPLYLGTFLHTFALALLMPPSGAVFAIITIGFFELRLIFAEESFLTAKLGQPYIDYRKRVPSLLPSIMPRVPASGAQAHWLQGILGEIYMVGVALSFAVFGWRYSAFLLIKCVIISLGVSLVARAFIPRTTPDA